MRKIIITRQKSGKGFVYFQDGKKLSGDIKKQIDALAIPPAWEDVEIAGNMDSKILAVGRDAAGRRQAIYNPKFRKKKDKEKFDRILRFAGALPKLRKQIKKDLSRKKLSRERVLACVVKLIDEAYFRVGNDQYAKENHSYGISTLRHKHTDVTGDVITFDFIGKSGKQHVKQIEDAQLARIIKRLDELPGYEVFKYIDEHGDLHDVKSADINDYIKEHMGEEFTAKDFRTWGGTLLATTELISEKRLSNDTERKKFVTGVVKNVAKRLGNTPAVARSSYIDPRVISAYIDRPDTEKVRTAIANMKPKRYMSKDEQCVLRLLQMNGK